jgi:hypothetical protein
MRPQALCGVKCEAMAGTGAHAGRVDAEDAAQPAVALGEVVPFSTARSRRARSYTKNGVDYVFGLAGTKPLARKIDEASDAVRTERAVDNKAVVRSYTETRHAAGSWHCERRVVAPHRGDRAGARHPLRRHQPAHRLGRVDLRQSLLRRGQAENLIKLHKSQLASDRTSCRSALANQVRLVLHTAAYWLLLTVRDAIPKPRDLATAEFTTIRLKLFKIAASVTETAGRVRLAFAAACPEADLFRSLTNAQIPRGP